MTRRASCCPQGQCAWGRLPVTLPGVRVHGGALALVFGMSLAVAGCSAEAEPRSLPPVPSASPSPTPLAVPPEAMAETAEGAVAFARHYFGSVVNAAYANLDAAEVRRLSQPECNSCANIVADVERLRNSGLFVAGQRFKVVYAEAAPAAGDGTVIVDFRYSSDPYVEQDAQGSAVRQEAAQRDVDAQALLAPAEDGWRVLAIRTLDT